MVVFCTPNIRFSLTCVREDSTAGPGKSMPMPKNDESPAPMFSFRSRSPDRTSGLGRIVGCAVLGPVEGGEDRAYGLARPGEGAAACQLAGSLP
jgi:hypothetical protein